MATILEKIVEQTAEDLKKRSRNISFKDLESLPGYESTRMSLKQSLVNSDEVSIIAEIKKGSPSKGIIRKDFNPVRLAEQYMEGGAAAISVLTDEPAFYGNLKYLEEVAGVAEIPVLRKDFIIDPYQVKEARAYGADAVLLIVTITEGNQLSELLSAVQEFGLDALVEVYNEEDLKVIDSIRDSVEILGANNRDLHSFEVNLHRGVSLLKKGGAGKVTVSESGLSSSKDLKLLHEEEIDAALIGEYFMRQPDPGAAVRKMVDECKAWKSEITQEKDIEL